MSAIPHTMRTPTLQPVPESLPVGDHVSNPKSAKSKVGIWFIIQSLISEIRNILYIIKSKRRLQAIVITDTPLKFSIFFCGFLPKSRYCQSCIEMQYLTNIFYHLVRKIF